MIRVLIDYLGDSIELPAGEVIVGRDLACQVRLNDPSVSRRHVRIVVRDADVTVEDLASHNGTELNGQPLTGVQPLAFGDELRLGSRTLRVKIIPVSDRPARDDAMMVTAPMRYPLPNEEVWELTKSDQASLRAGPVPDDVAPPEVLERNCPRCRTRVPVEEDRCAQCGYEWAAPGPGALTRAWGVATPARATGIERRVDARNPIELAVMYTSETLAFEAVALDLSRGGLFVATELLDPAGTPCRITVLADGQPAVSFSAVVRHVNESPSPEGMPAGLGIKFTQMGANAERWLARLLGRTGT